MSVLWLPFAPIWWFYQLLIKIPTAFLGLFVVPLLYKYRHLDIKDTPAWARPWINPEDWTGGVKNYYGSLPTWWTKDNGSDLKSFWRYHAIRNPADGLRNYKWLNLRINPEKVYYWTDKPRKHYEPWFNADGDKVPRVQWYICGQNVWVGVKLQWIREKTYSEFKFGTRIEPWDAINGPDPKGSRAIHGASFASKLILRRNHG